jgi:DNA-binding response OmpR family regulator
MSKHILIVEDEKILREVLAKKFEYEGFKVSTAENGEEGLGLIIAEKPDVVLLDIVMPKMNGYEVLRSLQESRVSIPPIIIISNSGQPVEVDKAINLGAKDYVVKAQITPEEVVKKVQKIFMPPTVKSATSTKEKFTEEALVDAKTRNSEHRILLIEDDQFLRELLSAKLKREGFAVQICVDGQEGLRTIQNTRPELVLLDVILPGLDGFSVLQQIRASGDQRVSKIPIVLLSNLGQDSDVTKGMQLGANEYLIKANLTIDEIIRRIQKYLK